MSGLGYDLKFADSESLRALIAADHKRYGTVIREAGITPN
jgi:tripartite-type tricarboxylate transporter receptor subunit TctC